MNNAVCQQMTQVLLKMFGNFLNLRTIYLLTSLQIPFTSLHLSLPEGGNQFSLYFVQNYRNEQIMLIYLVVHDSQVPLERGGCLWLLLGRNRFSSVAGRRWSRSVTRAVVNQHETGNYGDDDDAANPLALEGQRRDMSHTENHMESRDLALKHWIWGQSCIFLEEFSVQLPSFLTDAASFLFTHARVQINKMSVMSPKCFQHSLQRLSTHAEIKTSPENYGNIFNTTKGGGGNQIKTPQSAISSEQNTQLLNPEQQTQRIMAAMLPGDFIHNYCTTLIFIFTPSRFQVDPSWHGCPGSPL